MANQTKDQLTINALRERVELLEKKISNKDLIIQDYKDVINHVNDEIIKDLNFCSASNAQKQRTIEALKLENKEVVKQSRFYQLGYYITLSFALGSFILNIITLWK